MENTSVSLNIPAEAQFARTVRMTAANLAVLCDMSVDDVEDVRMAAEEGFVYACATAPQNCELSFTLESGVISLDFSLGSQKAEGEDLELAALLLASVCDEFEIKDGSVLHLVKRGEATHG